MDFVKQFSFEMQKWCILCLAYYCSNPPAVPTDGSVRVMHSGEAFEGNLFCRGMTGTAESIVPIASTNVLSATMRLNDSSLLPTGELYQEFELHISGDGSGPSEAVAILEFSQSVLVNGNVTIVSGS